MARSVGVPFARLKVIHRDTVAGTSTKTLAESRLEMFRPNDDDFAVTNNEPITAQGAPGHSTSFGSYPKGTEVESSITELSGARSRSASS